MIDKTLRMRFDAFTIKHDEGCWGWSGYKDKDGYGKIGKNNISRPAHRVSYELHVGEIPSSMLVLHRCDNPECTNPVHLFLGTQADNMADKVKKGRSADNRGERSPVAKLTNEQVVEIFSSNLSQRKLAALYMVSQRTISCIKIMKTWTHITSRGGEHVVA